MKRFYVLSLLSLMLGASASAAEPVCGYAQDRSREQRSDSDSRIQPLPASLVEAAAARIPSAAPQSSAATPEAGDPAAVDRIIAATRTPAPDKWRISTNDSSKPISLRWTDAKQGSVATVSIRETIPVARLNSQERLDSRRNASTRIRRAGYDLEELQELLKLEHGQAKSVPAVKAFDFGDRPSPTETSFEFAPTYEVAAPPRPNEQDKSPSDEVELVLEQLRRELRKEIEAAEREKRAEDERQIDEGSGINTESVIPRLAPTGDNNAASGALDLGLELEAEDAEDEVTAADLNTGGEVPPMPILPGAPNKNTSNWNQSSWTLGDVAKQEVPNPCEHYSCRQMWDCAGGRDASWMERAMRNMERTFQVTHGPYNESGQASLYSLLPDNRPICGPLSGAPWNIGVRRRSSHQRTTQGSACSSCEAAGGTRCTGPDCPDSVDNTHHVEASNDTESDCSSEGCTNSSTSSGGENQSGLLRRLLKRV